MSTWNKIMECVPNFSEGRDLEKIEKIVDKFRAKAGVKLLDYSNDEDHNRLVVTVVGEPEALKDALRTLSELLYRHYGQKVILLIDEYDVPLDKAHLFGYYDEMADLLKNLLSRALKSNESIYFSVLTGCLRIAKESIFTGLNNFKIYSISDVRFDEYFGFTEEEVKAMLGYYGLENMSPL